MTVIPNRIAGEAVLSGITFRNDPADGSTPAEIAAGTPDLVARACARAAEAFASYGLVGSAGRAKFLRAIAEEIEARGDAITAVGTAETGLPEARLQGERGRTTGQLRMFADHIESEAHLDRRHDEALPDRAPLPRPDLRLVQRPLGPVAVFGASNFPLAFSTAGGDTASALAAGCPVVVKGHPGHPGTGAVVGEAIDAAVARCGLHPGTFSLVNDGGPGNEGADSRAVGAALVQDPNIRAVGFTGSLAGGRALFDLACGRADPIPFFGELGSVNPVFILDGAAAHDAGELAEAWMASLTMGVGQFCTNPGVVVVPAAQADAFAQRAIDTALTHEPAVMLTAGIAEAFRKGSRAMGSTSCVSGAPEQRGEGRRNGPQVLTVRGSDFLKEPHLMHEVFGPLGLVVSAADADEMESIARAFPGQLTATIHMRDGDTEQARSLLPILEERAGRILFDGWPTGVEVADAMMHGGPWPASTNPSATSVGTLAIRRFLRPVCYQNMPGALLPDDLS